MGNWEDGYTATWSAVRVDPDNWYDTGVTIDIDSFTLTKNVEDQTPLIETGTITFIEDNIPNGFVAGWYRIEMLANFTDGSFAREPIATLLFEKATDDNDYSRDLVKANGYSVLKPVAESLRLACEWIAKGSNGAEWAASEIRKCTPAPVVVHGSFTVDDYYVFNGGEKRLTGVWTVLDSAGWIIWIEGDGTINIGPKPTDPAFTLDKQNSTDVMLCGITREQAIDDTYNRYIAVKGLQTAIVENHLVGSETSIEARGREIDYYDDDVILTNGETLSMYAARNLEELSIIKRRYSYSREYVPELYPMFVVRGRVEEMDEDELRIVSQSVDCTHGLVVSEEAVSEEVTWTAAQA